LTTAASAPALEQALPVSASWWAGGKFRLIPRFENDPQVIAFAQTVPGKLLLLAVFGLGLSLLDGGWALKLALVSCATFFPQARRPLVTVGTLLATDFFWFERGTLGTVTVHSAAGFSRIAESVWIVLPFILLCAGLMVLAKKCPQSPVAHQPLLTLMGIGATLTAAACYVPLSGFPRFAFWAFLDTFCLYFWYLAYALSDCAKPQGDGLFRQAGTLHAFWGSTSVPLPKGATHWRAIEAKTPEDLAIAMVKGVKLVFWCVLLTYVRKYYLLLVHGKLSIPTPGDCIGAFQAGQPLAWGGNWLSWPDDLLQELMRISIWGHALIATCRMAGFRALRNTYAPLSSRTIAEFWNRYYFYFKELLVDMFFYPIFIRCFKRNAKLRIFFATFVAASVGNTIFHLIRSLHIVASFGLPIALHSIGNYFFYSVLLALGIALSQIRSRKPTRTQGWFRERIVAPAWVLGFYCFVHVFEVGSPITGLRYFGFLLKGR